MSGDPAGFLLLEHVNVNVADYGAARRFYEALGCEQAVVPIHMNCGPHTQFHLPQETPAQIWRGTVTIAYTPEGLAGTRMRLDEFCASVCEAVEIRAVCGALAVTGPWGTFTCREASEMEAAMAKLPTRRPNTDATTRLGVVGIVAVSLPLASGTAADVARFYEETFGFSAKVSEATGVRQVVVSGGPVENSQEIRFYELEEGAAVPSYVGDHFCIYVGDFESCFERCQERGVLYVNPRFTWLDDSKTLEQAQHWQAFRILEVKSASGDSTLFMEEHEIRSRRHRLKCT
uniref:VOC domain-containing protein n=1 Tax=Noctiluca scintillans TaxID=2966 RepID=A0A7S1A376_NOCSC